MTVLGKAIFGVIGLLLVGGIFYGMTSYVSNDAAIKEETTVIDTPVIPVATTTTSTSTNATTTATTTATSSGKKMAFSEFIKKGGSYKCTVSQNVANMTTNGTVYISGDKIRGEFSMAIAGQSITTTMIARDGYTYTWPIGSPTKGNKVKVARSETGSGSGQASGTYTWDGSQIGDYNCEAQSVDDSLFTLPSSVTFTEI